MPKRKGRLRSFVLAGCLAASPACSFLVETSGLQGEAPDASTSSPDGKADAPAFVADSEADASSEGGADAPTGRLCADAGSAAVCDDFDDATTFGPGWTQEQSNGALTVVADGLSKPNALQAKVNGADGTAYLQRTIPFVKAVRCELDMKLADPPTGNEIDYLVIHTPAANHNLYIAHFDGTFALAEWKQSGVDRTVTLQTPPIGKWIHVILATDGKSLSLEMDGTATTLGNLVDVSGPTRQLQFGMPYTAGNAATRVLYDNIVCTTGP